MTVTNREKALAVGALLAVLYGVLGFTLRGRLDAIRRQQSAYRGQIEVLEKRDALIGQRPDWERRYTALENLLPVFDAGRRVDTYWLGVMGRLAAKNNLTIAKQQVGAEKRVGDAFEMPIECREWEGSLEALVGFLYDIQSEGAMLDVRQLQVKPLPNNPAQLRGSFTLYCAYLREDEAAPEAAPAARTNTP